MDWMEMLSINKRVSDAKKESPQERYARISIDLDDPNYVGKDIEIIIDGDYLAKIKYDGSATGTYFKFDNKRASVIYASEFRKRHTPFIPFNRIFLTNPSSQAGKKLIFFVGGAFAGEIEPSTGMKTGLIDSDGVDIDPAKDDRFVSHAGGHSKITLAVADTAQRMATSSTKVRWAIIAAEDKHIRWGFSSTVARAAGIGQKITAGSFITVEYCDLYDIYFVNETAAETPIIQIEYVEEA